MESQDVRHAMLHILADKWKKGVDKMSKWKKFVSMLLAAIFMLSTGVQAFAGTSLENALNKVNLYTKGS